MWFSSVLVMPYILAVRRTSVLKMVEGGGILESDDGGRTWSLRYDAR